MRYFKILQALFALKGSACSIWGHLVCRSVLWFQTSLIAHEILGNHSHCSTRHCTGFFLETTLQYLLFGHKSVMGKAPHFSLDVFLQTHFLRSLYEFLAIWWSLYMIYLEESYSCTYFLTTQSSPSWLDTHMSVSGSKIVKQKAATFIWALFSITKVPKPSDQSQSNFIWRGVCVCVCESLPWGLCQKRPGNTKLKTKWCDIHHETKTLQFKMTFE